jgi:DNA-binding transcriptional regulator YdaS (Cro superfamily)
MTKTPPDITKALKIAHELYGSNAGFARALGLSSRSVVNNWQDRGTPLPMVKKIERVTEGRITRHMLRPDEYGRRPRPNHSADVQGGAK